MKYLPLAARLAAASLVGILGCAGEITAPPDHSDDPASGDNGGPVAVGDPLDDSDRNEPSPPDEEPLPPDDEPLPPDDDPVPTDDDPLPPDDEPLPPDDDPLPPDDTPLPPDDGPRTTISYEVDGSHFSNPERGFMMLVDPTDTGDLASAASRGYTMVNALAYLDAYRTVDLPASYLADLANGFEEARSLGLKLTLRFRYDDGGGADASEAQMLRHIEQLEPLLRDYAGVIAVVQAGFIGRWGEWHGSTNGLDTPDGRGTILHALLDALPTNRIVQVRTPHFKDEQFPGGALTEAEAWTGTDIARVGHHNDCFLSSASDVGTYLSPVDEWMDYVAVETRYTPMGGETCAVYEPRTNCDHALSEMARMHWSYLNETYHPDVVDNWQSDGCYDEIKRRLGYRLELISANLPTTLTPGTSAALQISLRNTGFAAPFNERPVYLVLESSGARYDLRLTGVDPRHWMASESHLIDATVNIPEMAPGSYQLSLWLPDADPALAEDPAFAIRVANLGTWDSAYGLNVLADAITVD